MSACKKGGFAPGQCKKGVSPILYKCRYAFLLGLNIDTPLLQAYGKQLGHATVPLLRGVAALLDDA